MKNQLLTVLVLQATMEKHVATLCVIIFVNMGHARFCKAIQNVIVTLDGLVKLVKDVLIKMHVKTYALIGYVKMVENVECPLGLPRLLAAPVPQDIVEITVK